MIEELEDIIEEMADLNGAWGSHPEDASDNCGCRTCFTCGLGDRIRLAVANENLINRAPTQARISQLEAELAEAQRDSRRLDWLNGNPRLVVASTGYRGAADSWCWRDKTAALASHESTTIRAAIDAAMRGAEGL